MIEDLRIIAKDGGRLSADDCCLIAAAADTLERDDQDRRTLGFKILELTRQIDALKEQLAEATRPKSAAMAPSGLLVPPQSTFDPAAYNALASRLCGGYTVAGPGEKPW